MSTVAVPTSLNHLLPLLPAAPARIAEAGCGTGALAAALAAIGYDVTGIDRDAEMAESARRRGVRVLHADINDVSGQYDVVLFTRSLHHAADLTSTLGHVATLLAPGGLIVIEEFAWERVDAAAADFLYDHRSGLVAAGLLDADLPSEPLDAWINGHKTLHNGSAMLEALSQVGMDLTMTESSILWRLLDGRGGQWVAPVPQVVDALDAIRRAEEERILAGDLPSVGLVASVRC